MSLKIYTILAALSMISVSARAQDPVQDPATIVANKWTSGYMDRAQVTRQDPSLTSPARMTTVQATLAARRTENTAEIELGLELDPDASAELRASIKLGGPVGKEDPAPVLATLEGLGNQTKLTAGIRYLSKKVADIRRDAADKIDTFSSADLFKEIDTAWCQDRPADCWCQDPSRPAATRPAISTDDLSARARREFLRKILGDKITTGALFLTGEATYAAPTTFSFVDATTLTPLEEEHDGWTGALSVGWLPVVSPMPYVGFNYRYEESHSPRKPRQICTPFGSVGSLECKSLVIGAPVAQRKHLAQLELRRYFNRAGGAIGLRVTRDLENDVTGAELPVWLVRADSGLLNGGVSAGWRSDTEEYTFSVFVGSPFGR